MFVILFNFLQRHTVPAAIKVISGRVCTIRTRRSEISILASKRSASIGHALAFLRLNDARAMPHGLRSQIDFRRSLRLIESSKDCFSGLIELAAVSSSEPFGPLFDWMHLALELIQV